MAQKKTAQERELEENPSRAAMPRGLEPKSLLEVFEQRARNRDYRAALALAPAMGEEWMRSNAQSLMRDCSKALSYQMSGVDFDLLGWMEKLRGWGADPFLGPQVERGREPWSGGPESSVFKHLCEGGYWAYASSLALEDEDSKARAKAVLDRENDYAVSFEGYLRDPKKIAQGTRVQKRMAEGGAAALKLGFELGFEVDCVVDGSPWIFLCHDVASVEAFAKAGVDSTAKNKLGQGLLEVFAALPAAKQRQQMVAAARSAVGLASEASLRSDPDRGLREVLQLARKASWREVCAAAKEAHLDPLKIRDPSGLPILAVAIDNANFGLASDAVKAGADPQEVAGNPPLPVALRAMASAGASGSLSPAKREKMATLACSLLEKIDFSWRDAQGRRVLEAFAAAFPNRTPSLVAMVKWAELEPLDPSDPLWARATRACADTYAVRAFARSRPSEPWMTPGLGLMEHLLAQGFSEARFSNEWSRELEGFISNLSLGPSGVQNLTKLCVPEQWERAIERFWREGVENIARGKDKRFLSMGRELLGAMKTWSAYAARTEVQAFDMERMCKSIASAWQVVGGLAAPRNVDEQVVELGSFLCKAYPHQAGRLVLDILSTGRPAALGCAAAIWRRAREEGVDLRVPESHPFYETPDVLSSEVANHPMWREIEQAVVARASKSASKARL